MGQQLTYLVATSADGFIAGSGGSLDGFSGESPYLEELVREYPETFPTHLRGPLGIEAEAQHFSSVLMGRATYELGLKFGVTSPYAHLTQYVFSRTLTESPCPDVELVRDDPAQVVANLKTQNGLGLWLCGGGVLASSLVDQIDRLVLKVNPLLLGAGIPLFASGMPPRPLRLLSQRCLANGVCLVEYELGPRSA